jgi:hypothetical protein
MHIKQRIYPSLSATVVAAFFTFLCAGPLPAEEQASPKDTPQDSTAPAQQEGAASPAAPAQPKSQAGQTAGPPSGVEIVLPGGKVEAVLAPDMIADSEPLSPTREFAENAKQINLVLTSELANAASVQASLIAVSVEERQPNHKLGDWTLHLTPGERGITTLKLTAPEGGLSPGDYRMDLAVNGGPAQSLPFTVVPLFSTGCARRADQGAARLRHRPRSPGRQGRGSDVRVQRHDVGGGESDRRRHLNPRARLVVEGRYAAAGSSSLRASAFEKASVVPSSRCGRGGPDA